MRSAATTNAPQTLSAGAAAAVLVLTALRLNSELQRQVVCPPGEFRTPLTAQQPRGERAPPGPI